MTRNHLPQSRIGRGIDWPGRRAVGATWFMLYSMHGPAIEELNTALHWKWRWDQVPTLCLGICSDIVARNLCHIVCCLVDTNVRQTQSPLALAARFIKVNLRGGSHQLLARWILCARADSNSQKSTRAKQMLEPVLPGTEMETNPQACSRRF